MLPGTSQESRVLAFGPTSPDWLSHTWRLTRWNLKIARRRLMSKILLAILLVGFLLIITVILAIYLALDGQTDPDVLESTRALLTFPTIFGPIGGYTSFMGMILLCILAGALVGNEYSFGTQRLALSRGVSRAQLLAAQVGALAILALAIAGGMLALAALVGLTLGPLLGGSIPDLPPTGLLQILGFWLVISLQLFAYALIALLLATLGRSTAAGIGGSLGYILFEIIVLPIAVAIAVALLLSPSSSSSSFGKVLAHVQDFFLGPNLSALLSGVNQSPLNLGGGGGGSTGDGGSDLANLVIHPTQGLIVSLLYCALLIGASYWVLRKRDVTH